MSAMLNISSPVRQNKYSGCPLHCSTLSARRFIIRGGLAMCSPRILALYAGIEVPKSALFARESEVTKLPKQF